MPSKNFKLAASEIAPIYLGHGGCLATDRITVDGVRVGYMYREEPDNLHDSGWWFFAGDEDDGYVNNPANIEIYDLNTIANYDPAILPYLTAEAGSAFDRVDGDRFAPVGG